MPRLMHQVKPTMPPLRLLLERRFPLEMGVTLPEIRDLYDSGKAGRWNPHRDIDWTALMPAQYDAPVREAVRRTWRVSPSKSSGRNGKTSPSLIPVSVKVRTIAS